MKVTLADIELANRFVFKPTKFGYGTSMAEARVNPAQLDRLLKLKLITISTNRYCGGIASDTPAKGWLRNVTTFLSNTK